MFESSPYDIKFIQKASSARSGGDAFSYALIYRFFTRRRLKYIIRLEVHEHNLYVLKYYASRDKKKDDKYSRLTNHNDAYRILRTCLEVMLITLRNDDYASFGFTASSSIDGDKVEGKVANQRYRVYTELILRTIGPERFEHYSYKKVSSYLLINRKVGDINEYKSKVENNLLDLYDLDF